MIPPDYPDPGERIPLYLWILLIAVVIVTLVVGIPRILSSYRESGLAEIVHSYRSEQASPDDEGVAATLFFLSEGADGAVGLAEQQVLIREGSGLNAILERLFAGPDLAMLQKGFITAIPQQAYLTGSSIVDGVSFVEVAEGSFTGERDTTFQGLGKDSLGLAVEQVRRTVLANRSVREVIVISGGNIIGTQESP